jgi:hypothetical protein
MSISSVQRSLQSLRDKKLIVWEFKKNGIVTSNSYRLLLGSWQPLGQIDRTLGQVERTLGQIDRPCTEVAQPEGGVLGSGDTSHLYTLDSSKEESNIDNIDKNNTQKKSIKIPERFKPISKLLIEWWKNHKVGVKTETSWSLLIGELNKILSDESVNGNTEAISQTLYNGITSSENGKPWQSIRYSNWILYNKKQWLAFKESQSTVEKSPQRSTIIIPDYHKNV